jgi:hypothetical protein
MPLVDLTLPAGGTAMPGEVRSFLREANRRIERFQRTARVPGFVPSDYERVYDALRTVAEANLAPGRRLCEWGSGFGVVACLAAMLDFDACGIEIDGELVDAARQLAADFDLPVEFVRGSLIPRGGDAVVDAGGAFAWFSADEGGAYEELGLDPDDFDVIFAYPWPDEEDVTGDLFERYASPGAVLLTYHGSDDLRARRKVRPRSRARPR